MATRLRIQERAPELARNIQSNSKLVTALHLAVWLGSLTIFTLVAFQGLNIEISIYRASINLALLALLFYINAILAVNRFLSRGRYIGFYLLVFFLLFVFSEFRTWMNHFFELEIYQVPLENKLLPRILAYSSSAVIILVSTLFQLLQNQSRKRQMNLILENKYQQAQLQFLKAQINPHFLFNTLNNIYALALLESKDTPKMILKLSELLRYAIYEGQKPSILLSKEWAQIEQLVELFQMKAAQALDIQLEVIGNLNQQQIEPMMLIPLVENCLKHADFELNKKAFVKISLVIQTEGFIFSSSNSKAEVDYKKDQVGGVGLQNIQSRLDLNYTDRYELQVDNRPQRFDLRLQMPFYTQKPAQA